MSTEITDPPTRVQLRGRFILLHTPEQPGASAVLIGWKSGRGSLDPPSEASDVPLTMVAQAAPARRRLAQRCPVVVRWIYSRTGAKEEWVLDQGNLAKGWRGIVEIASSILRNDWTPCPGTH